jgi:hypothetical protein
MLSMHEKVIRQLYRPRNYTQLDELRGLLLLRLGGTRLANVGHRALGLPSVDVLRRRRIIPPLIVSAKDPTKQEIETNTRGAFAEIDDLLKEKRVVHQVLMFDEIKVEERPRWCPRTNNILGVCREHTKKLDLKFSSQDDVHVLLDGVAKKNVHLAVEVSRRAIFELFSWMTGHGWGARADDT